MWTLNGIDRLTTAPFAAGVAALAEIHQQQGGSEESALELYNGLMKNIDYISLAGQLGFGAVASMTKTAEKVVPKLAQIGTTLKGWLAKTAANESKKVDFEDKVVRSFARVWIDRGRGLMVTLPSTTIRNLANVAGLRAPVEGAVDAAEYTVRNTAQGMRNFVYGKVLGQNVAQIESRIKTPGQVAVTLKDMGKWLAEDIPGTSNKYHQFIEDVFTTHPKEIDVMLSRYVGDAQRSGGKTIDNVIDVLNTFNWKQEIFNRKVRMFSSIDDQLMQMGYKGGVDDILKMDGNLASKELQLNFKDPNFNMADIVTKAANDALYYTFARDPTDGAGKAIMEFFRKDNLVSNTLQATGIPYPRFAINAIQYMNEMNPLKAYKVFKLLGNKPVSAMDMKDIAGSVVGSGLIGLSYEAAKSGLISEDGNGIMIDGKQYDTNAFLGPYLPFFKTGYYLNNIMNNKGSGAYKEEMFMGWLDSIYNTPSGQELGLTQLKDAIVGLMDLPNGTIVLKDNLSDILKGEYKTEDPVLAEPIKNLSIFASNTLAKVFTPFSFGSDLLSTTLDDETISREIYHAPGFSVAPILNKFPGAKQLIPERFSPTRGGPVRYPNPILKQLTGLVPVEKNYIEKEMDRVGFARKQRTNPKTGIFVYDQMMNERVGAYMEGFSEYLKKDPIVGIDLGDKDPIYRQYSKLNKFPKQQAYFIASMFTAARDYADKDVQEKLKAMGRDDILQKLANKRIPDLKKRAMKEAGAVAPPAKPAKLGSKKIYREQIEYGVAPTNEFHPD
jgi:hypothetical protein